jgi:hypothetical protein
MKPHDTIAYNALSAYSDDERSANEKPVMVLVVGHPSPDATVPVHATIKKPLEQISSWL